MQSCPICGIKNKDTAKFCNSCGHRMTALLVAGDLVQGRYRMGAVLRHRHRAANG